MTKRYYNSLLLFMLGLVITVVIVGCPGKKTDVDTRPELWRSVKPGSKFVVLVIGAPEIAKKVRQLAGTWEELTQASFDVQEMSTNDVVVSAQKPTADAVLCSIQLEAQLAATGYPALISQEMQLATPALWDDILELYRNRMTKFGTETMFIPFGSQFFVCYYRADLLVRLKLSPPKSWDDYAKLKSRLQEYGNTNSSVTWSGAMEPTAPGWAARTFLTRAAAYVTHRDFYSTLFDAKTMTPLIDTEPFVRALTEMRDTNPAGTPPRTADDVRAAFWRGETGLAITFPTAARSQGASDEKSADPDFKAGIAAIPGSSKGFNPEKKIWDDRRRDESMQIPTLISGHVGMISAETPDPVSMYKLLLWISGEDWGTSVFSVSPESGIGRKSAIRQVSQWVEKQMPPEQTMQYVSVLTAHWNGNEVFTVPSLPGYDEYMSVLDREVSQTLNGVKEPQAALGDVAKEWQVITEKHGIDSQRKLYRQCRGIAGESL
ncbi:MAG: extracellular solute-binding protein [Planctomycetaceae bacterium]|nr:extracellular solute-binding protein [Planctomycetaceae bacterium]